MAKLTLVSSRKTNISRLDSWRAAPSEGEAAKALLEAHGYPSRRQANGQWELLCPFHNDPGPLPAKKKANFYLDALSSRFYCHASRCGMKGNLRTLERRFGINQDDEYVSAFKTREKQLVEYEAALTPQLRQPFYADGLNDVTIDRFRLGYDPDRSVYVIPYLEGRRPVAFRFYDPTQLHGPNGSKYWWEHGTNARLYNVDDAGGDTDGKVWITEGEKKAMLLTQMGYAAVAVPGVTTFKDEWHAAFRDAREVIICFDNDDPDAHRSDDCRICQAECHGHNPGQDGAVKLVERFGWRARNVVLPRPEGQRKVDINEYLVRDGFTGADLAELAFGTPKTPYHVQSLTDIVESPPDEHHFLVKDGVLNRGGRLLVTGAPKSGKSLLVEHLALSLGAGIPFLNRFEVDHPTRVLLLDRELSSRSLYERFVELMDARPGYRAAMEHVLVDHKHMFQLDQEGGAEVLAQLVSQNGAEVVILDTAYKFFGGDLEKASSVAKAFRALDQVIDATGVSVVVTHHHRKGSRGDGRDDEPHPDQVVGSFLWTGWPNAAILLNFPQKRVEDPFTTVAHFTAFRDAAPPDPLMLHRDSTSLAYQAITPYAPPRAPDPREYRHPSTQDVAELLMQHVPVVEADFLVAAAGHFGCHERTVRPFLVDALASLDLFIKTDGRVPVIKFAHEREEESWEEEQIRLFGQEEG